MPYEPPPELSALSLIDIAEAVQQRRLPPVDQWQPRETADSDMRIAADGTWFHEGRPITRKAMVRAFSTLLMRDDAGQHWLVTPQCRQSIVVEDAAFIAVDMQAKDDALAFRLNTEDLVLAGPDHPLRAEGDAELPAIYLAVRHGCEARLDRSTWMQLAERALAGGAEELAVDKPGRAFRADARMSTLFERLQRLFDEGHGVELHGLRSDFDLAPPEIRPAAVLIAVTERPEPGVLLTHRPKDMRAHPGQVAFPGGKLDPGEDAVAAALREAHEELAINPSSVRVIGASDRFVTGSGYDVTPVLGIVPPDLPIAPNPAEVSDWFEAPLRFVLDPANHVARTGEFRGRARSYIEIDWQGHRIWGVTAAIIANLSRRLAWKDLTDG